MLNMMRKSVLSVHTICCVYIDLQALWFCAELEKSAIGPEPALGQPHAGWSGVIFWQWIFQGVKAALIYEGAFMILHNQVSLLAGIFGIWNFVLFNDAWSQKGHSASNTTVILASSSLLHLLLLHIIITFAITFSLIICITNLLLAGITLQ